MLRATDGLVAKHEHRGSPQHSEHMAAVRRMRIWRIMHRRLVCAAGQLAEAAVMCAANAESNELLIKAMSGTYAVAARVQQQIERAQTEVERLRARCCSTASVNADTGELMGDVPTRANVAQPPSPMGLQTANIMGGIWPHPWPPQTPSESAPGKLDFAPICDAEAVELLMSIEHLESVQDRVERLHKKGFQLCRKTVETS